MRTGSGHVGFAEAFPRMLHRRTGARYVDVGSAIFTVFGVLTSIAGVATTALYIDGSLGDYLALAALSAFWYLVDGALAMRVVARHGAPVRRWLAGERGPGAAEAAWEAAAALPVRMARRPGPFVLAAIAAASWDALAAVVLDLSAASAATIFPASFGLFAYWSLVRMLALELGMRPVLEELAPHLPPDADLRAPRVPLRWRFLAALPAISWGSGVIVAGITLRAGAEGADALIVAAVAAVAVALGVSIWLSMLLADTVTGPIVALGEATRRVRGGDLDVRVPVVSTDEAGEVAGSFNAMVGGLRERERLREAFGAFVDPTLTQRVLDEGIDLSGEELVLSVLFVDVRGFTAFCEQAAAQEVVARLNELYAEVVPAILRHGGHANKFVGDGLLAVFGAPERAEDHADRAVAAALEVARLVREMFGDDLRVGIGVNSGPVIAGTIGGGGRVDFTVIGDTVNTAARVEAATRQTGDDVLITAATAALLRRDHGGFDERPPLPLKGKAEPARLLAARGA